MSSHFSCMALVLVLSAGLAASAQTSQPQAAPANGGDFSSVTAPITKVPTGVIMIKGAWSSASDSITPVPEGGAISNDVLKNGYFGITYPLPSGWTQQYEGPPPSDRGRYVLAQLRPADATPGHTRGTILITAEDLFFTPLPANNALQLINYEKDTLQAEYKIEEPPTPTRIAGRPFMFLAYWSPVAELHWYIVATEIRCHALEIIFTSRDTKQLQSLLLELDKMTLPVEADPTSGMGGGGAPVCMKNYARDANLITKVDPVLSEHRFNPVPVRIIIDKQGKVKHIHFLSSFPEQAKAIGEALAQWRFKPYLREGRPVEVETGIMFGTAQSGSSGPSTAVE